MSCKFLPVLLLCICTFQTGTVSAAPAPSIFSQCFSDLKHTIAFSKTLSPDGIANQPFPESSKTIHTLLTDHSKRTSTSVCASFDRASFLGQLRNTVDGAYSDCMLAGFDLRSVFIRGYPKEDTSGRSRVDYHNLVLEVVDRVQELCRDFEMEYSQQ